MMSGDSSAHESRSHPHTGYDIPDEARPGSIAPVIPLSSTGKLNHEDTDTEVIEEITTIIRKTLPSPEPSPKIERNGNDNNGKLMEKKFVEEKNTDDDNCVKCIYIVQQCCDCVIV